MSRFIWHRFQIVSNGLGKKAGKYLIPVKVWVSFLWIGFEFYAQVFQKVIESELELSILE